MKPLLGALAAVLLFGALMAASFMLVPSTTPGGSTSAPSAIAVSGIPADYLADYQAAAKLCPGLSWTILAGIGRVETDHGGMGQDPAQTSPAGAQGPMQFLPATFGHYALPGEGDINNPKDAIDAAAKMLCADGAGNPSGVSGAIFAYNHLTSYVQNVEAWAQKYGGSVQPLAAVSADSVGAAGQIAQEGLTPVLPGAPYPTGGFPFGQCTYWAALNHPVNWSGNAADWAANALAAGAQETMTAAPGEIVVYAAGGGYSGFGHVAIVLAVSGSNFTVSEMNYLGVGLVDQRVSTMADVATFIR